MKNPLPALAFVALALAPSLALGQEPPPPAAPPPPLAPQAMAPQGPPMGRPPSTGIGMIVTGSVFTGLGVVNLVTAPICTTSAIQSSVRGICLGASLVFAGITLVIGVPVLAVGVSRHNKYAEWKEQGGVVARLTDLGVTPERGGASVTWQTAF